MTNGPGLVKMYRSIIILIKINNFSVNCIFHYLRFWGAELDKPQKENSNPNQSMIKSVE